MPSPRQVKFLADLKDSLQKCHDDMVKLADKCDELQSRQDAGVLTSEYAQAEIESLRHKMETRRAEGGDQVHDLISKRLEELDAADALDPSKLTPDAELLKLDVLDAHDLAQMQKRNAGNATMGRLIVKYAQHHGVEVDVPSYVYELALEKNSTRQMPEVTKVGLKWVGDKKNGQRVLDQLFAQVGV